MNLRPWDGSPSIRTCALRSCTWLRKADPKACTNNNDGAIHLALLKPYNYEPPSAYVASSVQRRAAVVVPCTKKCCGCGSIYAYAVVVARVMSVAALGGSSSAAGSGARW